VPSGVSEVDEDPNFPAGCRMKRSSTIGEGMCDMQEEVKVATLSEMQAWKLLGQRRKDAMKRMGGT